MQEYSISDVEFNNFSEIIYSKTGINLHYGKKPLLLSRLSKILRTKNLSSFKDYLNLVLNDKTNHEMIQLIDAISTNVTYFFREEQHFEFLKSAWYPEYLSSKAKSINVWSAACSSGEEPYSIAITLHELTGLNIPFTILASDISTRILARAQRAIYPKIAIEKMTAKQAKTYFQEGKNSAEGYIKVKKEYRDLVRFKQINLMEAEAVKDSFDLIFCRNVMIYFDTKTKEKVVQSLSKKLNTGGYLFIGLSESLSGIKHNLEYIKPAIYRKGISKYEV